MYKRRGVYLKVTPEVRRNSEKMAKESGRPEHFMSSSTRSPVRGQMELDIPMPPNSVDDSSFYQDLWVEMDGFMGRTGWCLLDGLWGALVAESNDSNNH